MWRNVNKKYMNSFRTITTLSLIFCVVLVTRVMAVDFSLPEPVKIEPITGSETENHLNPSLIKDTSGYLLYYQVDNVLPSRIDMHRLGEAPELETEYIYSVLPGIFSPAYPTVFSYGDGKGLFWYEPLDNGFSNMYRQQLVLFGEEYPNSDEVNKLMSFYDRNSYLDYPPQFKEIGQTLYLEGLRKVSFDPGNNRWDLFLRSYDFEADSLNSLTLQFSSNGLTGMASRADTLIILKSWVVCSKYQNLSCVEWAVGYKSYYILNNLIEKIGGLYSYTTKDEADNPTDIIGGMFGDEQLYTLKSNRQVVRINFETGRFELVKELAEYTPDSLLKITPLATKEYNTVIIQPENRQTVTVCLFDYDWSFVDSATVPVRGEASAFSDFVYSEEKDAIVFAYAARSEDSTDISRVYLQTIGLDDNILNPPPPPPDGVPSLFSLSQNYPNPFNPSTTVEYELPIEGHVRVEVYNIVGQKVATLIDQTKEAGVHYAEWDGSDLSSGMYLIRAEYDNQVKTVKSVLVK